MTFTDLVNAVLSATNATTATATTRIGTYVNMRYRQVVSTCGMQTSVNTVVDANTVIGSRFVTFTCEKVFSCFDPTQTPPAGLLFEWTIDEMRRQPVGSDPAQHYAVYGMGASTVVLMLDTIAASVYALSADAQVNITDLSGTQTPNFPADFHDILFMGALADELAHLEKYEKSTYWENKYDGGDRAQHKGGRLADLRYFIATSNYKTIYQGKSSDTGTIAQPTVS